MHHFGTGTLFRVADHFFLVTAGHVIKQACAHGKTLGIGGSDDGRFVTLSGQTLVSSEGQYGSSADLFDIALHRFSPDAVARLAKKRFLIFDDIEFDSQSATAVYTIFGFPAVWSSPSRSTDEKVIYKALQHTTYRYDRGLPKWHRCYAPRRRPVQNGMTFSIRPYEGNPRVNDQAVDAVAASIRFHPSPNIRNLTPNRPP